MISCAIVLAMLDRIQELQTIAREPRGCERCHAQMERLGKLPAIRAKRAMEVFRCYSCNNVAVEQGENGLSWWPFSLGTTALLG